MNLILDSKTMLHSSLMLKNGIITKEMEFVAAKNSFNTNKRPVITH